jgi:ABC-type nitrate/sulfonate/bicarbonate transport system substrate-binding protein
VGFVPLCDCAPLAVASELGLFEKNGLNVELRREVGWATIRDKIIYRELDAVHALAPMVFAASFGLGSIQADCVTGLVLSLEGNAITVAQSLHGIGVSGGETWRKFVNRRGGPLIFGIPFLYSSHYFLLRAWLQSHGLRPERDVQFAVVPPPQMPVNLKAGHLHGYCVGEPWNSVAVSEKFGWRAATSAEIAPWHPEKVLMVRRDFAESRTDDHERLIAALLEACRFCASPGNRETVIEILTAPAYVKANPTVLLETFGRAGQTVDFSPEAHEPSAEKAAWVLDHLVESELMPAIKEHRQAAARIFRADIFQNATQTQNPHELANVH